MTQFTFSIEQLRGAPPEVQRWVATEIGRALAAVAAPAAEPAQREAMRLAACTVPEAAQVFELIGDDPIAARLFFELARENAFDSGVTGVRALRLVDLLHHLGLPEQALSDGLAAIERAFLQVHGEHAGSLFGFDEAGHLYLHEATQVNIRRLWQELAQSYAAAERQPSSPAISAAGFIPPHLGPSDEVAAHAAQAHRPADLPL